MKNVSQQLQEQIVLLERTKYCYEQWEYCNCQAHNLCAKYNLGDPGDDVHKVIYENFEQLGDAKVEDNRVKNEMATEIVELTTDLEELQNKYNYVRQREKDNDIRWEAQHDKLTNINKDLRLKIKTLESQVNMLKSSDVLIKEIEKIKKQVNTLKDKDAVYGQVNPPS